MAAAEQMYRQVLQLHPQNANAWCYLGIALHDRKQFAEAIAAYQNALAHQPKFPIALSNLGNTLNALGRHGEAEASCLRAITLQPDYASPYNNLGAALVAQGRLAEAVERFDDALRLNPQYASALSNRGAAFVQQGRFDDAQASNEEALRLDPKFADAHKNRAIVMLLQGDFENGWPAYEWRLHSDALQLPQIEAPRWNGEDLAGKTLLLWAEQGLGDTIQFIRYASLVKGARVVAAVQKPLLPLLASFLDVDQLLAQDDLTLPFDAYCPLLSLPGVFQTRLDSIPAETSYLRADPALTAKWRLALGEHKKLRVGVSWQGNPDHALDRQRSAPLEAFRGLARIPHVELICLQKGFGVEQVETLSPPFPLRQLGDDVDTRAGAFMDTAAIMQSLDLVLTTDTAIAHLAGALGVETWLVLPLAPDWRWLLGRDDTPWYPSVRLFRQTSHGDWTDVFVRVGNALQARRVESFQDDQKSNLATQAAPIQAASIQAASIQAASIQAAMAPGELIDKITILQIKSERIDDEQKRRNVNHEKTVLEATQREAIPPSAEVERLQTQLKNVNEQLWDIEDAIRLCEQRQDFGARFIELARSVYKTNDQRAALKRQINDLLHADIVEEKSYQPYDQD